MIEKAFSFCLCFSSKHEADQILEQAPRELNEISILRDMQDTTAALSNLT